MTLTKEPKATKDIKIEKPAEKSATAVAKILESFALMPIHLWAECRNQSIPSFLNYATGLSKARISKGNLDTVRPSTLRKIEEYQQKMLKKHIQESKVLAEVHKQIAIAPKTRSGMNAIWAGWMHDLEIIPDVPLPLSKALALTIDELIEALLAACGNNDLAEFKRILLHHIGLHNMSLRAEEEPNMDLITDSELAYLLEIEDWLQAESITRNFLDTIYWDSISALDAEWNSHYFSGYQGSPMFPLVMVRPQDGLLEGRKLSSHKNLIFRPSRRLLEFLYALAYYIKKKEWPDRAPSPKTLANILFKPGETEVLENSVVSNYFDGSTKLTFDLICDYWIQMCHHFKHERECRPPFPMIMLALQWQSLLVLDKKGRSFIIPSLEKYDLHWRHHRQRWEAHRAKQEELSPQASHRKDEVIEWPAWMFNQPSYSS